MTYIIDGFFNDNTLNIKDYSHITNTKFIKPFYNKDEQDDILNQVGDYYVSSFKQVILKIFRKYPIECILLFGTTKETFDIYDADTLNSKYLDIMEKFYHIRDPKEAMSLAMEDEYMDINFRAQFIKFEKLFNRYLKYCEKYICEKIGAIILKNFADKVSDKTFKPVKGYMYMVTFKNHNKGDSSSIKISDKYLQLKKYNVLKSYDDCCYTIQSYDKFKDRRTYAYDYINYNVFTGKSDKVLNLLQLEIHKQKMCDDNDIHMDTFESSKVLTWYMNKNICNIRCTMGNCIVCVDSSGYSRMYLYRGSFIRNKLIGMFDKDTPYSIYHDMRMNEFKLTSDKSHNTVELNDVYPIKIDPFDNSAAQRFLSDQIVDDFNITYGSGRINLDDVIVSDINMIYDMLIYKLISHTKSNNEQTFAYKLSYSLEPYGIPNGQLNVDVEYQYDNSYNNRSYEMYVGSNSIDYPPLHMIGQDVLVVNFMVKMMIYISINDSNVLWKHINLVVECTISKNDVLDVKIHTPNSNINLFDGPYDWMTSYHLYAPGLDIIMRKSYNIYVNKLRDCIINRLKKHIGRNIAPMLIESLWHIYYFIMNCYSAYEELCAKRIDQFVPIYFKDNIYNFIAQYHYFNRDGIDREVMEITNDEYDRIAGATTIYNLYMCGFDNDNYIMDDPYKEVNCNESR